MCVSVCVCVWASLLACSSMWTGKLKWKTHPKNATNVVDGIFKMHEMMENYPSKWFWNWIVIEPLEESFFSHVPCWASATKHTHNSIDCTDFEHKTALYDWENFILVLISIFYVLLHKISGSNEDIGRETRDVHVLELVCLCGCCVPYHQQRSLDAFGWQAMERNGKTKQWMRIIFGKCESQHKNETNRWKKWNIHRKGREREHERENIVSCFP